jgi:hypothetical protein
MAGHYSLNARASGHFIDDSERATAALPGV